MRTYNELSLDERVEIQRRLEAGDSLRAIARSLGRAASTISREHRRASSGVTYLSRAGGATASTPLSTQTAGVAQARRPGAAGGGP